MDAKISARLMTFVGAGVAARTATVLIPPGKKA